MRWAQRIGRRGLLLVLGGLAWMLIGISLLTTPAANRFTSPDAPGPQFLDLIERPAIGIVWVGCGFVSALVGAVHDRAIAQQHDAVGFNALLIPPMLWMFAFGWAIIAHFISGGREGSETASYGFAIWVIVSAFIIVVAGWPDPSDSHQIGRGRRGAGD
jgi:hypothetical protein